MLVVHVFLFFPCHFFNASNSNYHLEKKKRTFFFMKFERNLPFGNNTTTWLTITLKKKKKAAGDFNLVL